MSNLDPRIERLIVRRLDGELGADEEIELDRELLRNPQARALLEEYERMDAAVGGALRSTIAGGPTRVAPVQGSNPQSQRGYSRAWWALPAAVAACIALMMVFRGPSTAQMQLADQPMTEPAPIAETTPIFGHQSEGRRGVQLADYAPDAVDRSTNTDALYILGTDGNIYVIEQQRVRTARRPNSGIRLASGDF